MPSHTDWGPYFKIYCNVWFWVHFRNFCICRRSDYIIGFIASAIGPNKSKKLTRLIAPVHNIRGKVWMKNNIDPTLLHRQAVIGCEAMYAVFHLNFAVYIVWRRYKPCDFLGFVWTDCWGNKSYYVITSPANCYIWCLFGNFHYWHLNWFEIGDHWVINCKKEGQILPEGYTAPQWQKGITDILIILR